MANELNLRKQRPQRKSVAEKMDWVHEKMRNVSLEHLRHVIALKGCANAGKTSVLKCLIAELYRRDPKSWISKEAFDPSRVDVSVSKGGGEYRGVFVYKGIRIAVNTRGDDAGALVSCFRYFASCAVTIGITAVRCHAAGRWAINMERIYEEFCSEYDFECHEVNMPVNRKLRTQAEEMEVAMQIIAKLDELVASMGADSEHAV